MGRERWQHHCYCHNAVASPSTLLNLKLTKDGISQSYSSLHPTRIQVPFSLSPLIYSWWERAGCRVAGQAVRSSENSVCLTWGHPTAGLSPLSAGCSQRFQKQLQPDKLSFLSALYPFFLPAHWFALSFPFSSLLVISSYPQNIVTLQHFHPVNFVCKLNPFYYAWLLR